MQKLLTDEPYAKEVSEDLRQLIERLNSLSEKLTSGDGTAAKLINDPSIYDAVQDIIVGIDESRFLRWLIRNRQKEGIETRYHDAKKKLKAGETPAPAPAPAPSKGGGGGGEAAGGPGAPGADAGAGPAPLAPEAPPPSAPGAELPAHQ